MASREYSLAAHANALSTTLDIPFGAAWRVVNCLHKYTYQSRAEALDHIRDSGYRAYQCDICNKWHITTKGEDWNQS